MYALDQGRGACASRPWFFWQEVIELMTTTSSMAKKNLAQRGLIEQLRVHGWTWKSVGAVFGLGFGIICPLVGSILTSIAWLTGADWHGLHLQRDGTVLLFLTIPLLIFGAHCLDLMDQPVEKARKL
jgi:hypothetical protein